MAYLVDTNVLLRLTRKSDPEHVVVRAAIRSLRQRGEVLYFTSQKSKFTMLGWLPLCMSTALVTCTPLMAPTSADIEPSSLFIHGMCDWRWASSFEAVTNPAGLASSPNA